MSTKQRTFLRREALRGFLLHSLLSLYKITVNTSETSSLGHNVAVQSHGLIERHGDSCF